MAQTLRIPGGLPDVTEIGPDGTVRPTLRSARDPFARTAGDIQMVARTAPGVPRTPVMRNASPAIRDVTVGLRTAPPRLNIMGANDGPRPQPLGAPNTGPELPGGMRPNAGPTPQPMGAPNAGPAQRDWAARPAATTPFKPPEKPTLGWFRSALRRGGELATSARSNVGAAGRTAGAVAVDAGKITAPTAAGFGAAALVNNLRQSAADSAPAFVAPEAKPGDIPTVDPATGRNPYVAPPVNAGSFLNQTETGRNVGNAIMALPGGGAAAGAVQGALRAAPLVGRAAQVAGLAATATPAAVAAAQGYAGGDIATAGTASPQAAAAPSTQPPVTDGPLDTRSFPAPTGTPPNEVLRRGNSFSGADVREGFTYTGDGAPKGSGTVTALNTIGVNGYLRQLDNIRGLGTPDSTVGQGAGGIGGGRIGDDLREKTDAGRTPAGLSARQAANLQQQQAQLAQQKEIAGMQIASQNQGQNQGLRIAEMNNATSRENNAATQRTNLRGQELDFEGRLVPLRMQQAMRERAAATVQAAGSVEKAIELATAAGDLNTAEALTKQVAAGQAVGAARDTQAKERAATTERLFKPYYTTDVVDKDGKVTGQKFDEVGAAKAAARLRGQYGEKWDGLPEATKSKLIGDAAAQERNAAAEEQVVPGFVDRLRDSVGAYKPPAPVQSGQRNIAGGTIDTGGLLTSGATGRDTIVRLRDGSVINYGNANRDQLADIEARIKAAK